ncbi:MAG: hypothetical protein QM657_16555 [Lacrimispora sp.]|uniref:hypothetical protein n=1 Tax=Lacrimispora sp. TaxID=2719234 RepID=UPI0039E2AED7
MKKTINRILSLLLTAILFIMPSSVSLAAMPKSHIASSINISPQILLTHHISKWNDDKMIEFDVTYVVDDANHKIVEVRDAYVSAKSSEVGHYTNASVYLAPQGTYATVKCNYYKPGSSKTYTALIKITP